MMRAKMAYFFRVLEKGTQTNIQTFSKIIKGCRDGSRDGKTILNQGEGIAMCRQGRLCKDYTSNPFPTSFLYIHAWHRPSGCAMRLLEIAFCREKKM